MKNGSLTYETARKLAQQIGIDTPEQLASLISDLGIGEVKLDISNDSITAKVSRTRPLPRNAVGLEGDSCEFERGLLDGSLELITRLPVETVETGCSGKGDKDCIFESVREEFKGSNRFVPVPVTGSSVFRQSAKGLNVGVKMGPTHFHSWFLDLFARELARSRRHGRPLSFLYLDIDDLGQINASHGRAAGDRVLYVVAAVLSQNCRAEDYLWHPGEDGFAMVLTETDIDESGLVTGRLIEQIQASMAKPDMEAAASVSIGYSSFPANAENVNDLFSAAKSALYQAKAEGKGRAVAAGNDNKNRAEPAMEAGAATDYEHVEDAPVGHAGTVPAPIPATLGDENVEDTTPPAESFVRPIKTDAGAIEDSGEAVGEVAAGEEITVVVASKKPLLLAGLSQIVSAEKGMEVLDEVADPEILYSLITDLKPNLVIADLPSATANDFEAIKLIKDENLPSKILIFAAEIDQDVIKIAVEMAVDGVILQDSPADEILGAIKSINEGKTVLPDEVQAAIDELVDDRRMLGDLSEREQQVLKLMAEGKTNSQISEELFVTVNTIRFHLANIYQKLGVSNRTEAANCYLRQDINPDTPSLDTT